MTTARPFVLSVVQEADGQLMRRYIEILRSVGRFDPELPYLARHIRQHAASLRAGYIGQTQLEPSPETSKWLKARITELAEFSSSVVPAPIGLTTIFARSRSAATTTLSIGAFLFVIPAAAAGLSATFIAIVNSCFCEVLAYTWLASMLGCGLLALALQSGSKKFTATAGGVSADALERNLFDRLEVRRPVEPPPWAYWPLALAGSASLTFIARAVAKRGFEHDRHVPTMLLEPWTRYFAFSLLVLALALGVWAFRRRSPSDVEVPAA
jgi:hypothetical protein